MKAVDAHAAPLAFSYDVAMTDACRGGGHAGKHALRQAGTNEAILLLTQACLIVIMVTILELSAHSGSRTNYSHIPTENSLMVPTVEWKDGAVRLLDQSRLPEQVEFLMCRDYQAVAGAIRDLKVRGAPAIGVTAAMGVALGVDRIETTDYDVFVKAASAICDHLATTRPTAVNLFWAIERMKRRLAATSRAINGGYQAGAQERIADDSR